MSERMNAAATPHPTQSAAHHQHRRRRAKMEDAGVLEALDVVWLFVSCALVIVMQSGFAAYEVGTIRATSSERLLLKNIGDAAVAFVAWFMFGYGIANGDVGGGIVGGTGFFFVGAPFEENADTGENSDSISLSFLSAIFGWAFAATCVTIVSGAVADRIMVKAYYIYAFLTAGVFYPIVAYAAWGKEGLFAAGRDDPLLDCGCRFLRRLSIAGCGGHLWFGSSVQGIVALTACMTLGAPHPGELAPCFPDTKNMDEWCRWVIDFAGSGVVHMLGGFIGLALAALIKPRPGRFFGPTGIHEHDGNVLLQNFTTSRQLNEGDFSANDPTLMTIGCMLLWFGWYGFNCGSTYEISTEGSRRAAGRAAMNTTIGAAFGAIFSMVFELLYHLRSPEHRRGVEIRDVVANPADPTAVEMARRASQEYGGNGPIKWPFSTHKSLHSAACNGILAGLVSITAGCATMHHGVAILASFVGAGLYHLSYRGFICCWIDDAVSAAAVHGICGFWGLWVAGFGAMDSAKEDAGYHISDDGCTRARQFGVNLLFSIAIIAYAIICFAFIAFILHSFGLLERAAEGESLPAHISQRVQREINRVQDRVTANTAQVERVDQQIRQTPLDQLRADLDHLQEQLDNFLAGNPMDPTPDPDTD